MIPISARDLTFTHRALGISEVLRLVFEALELEDSKGTLASAAQVCSWFTESALDMIWRHLDVGIFPLLSVLPLKNKDGELIIHSVTDEDAWRKFDNYAYRVREFTHRCWDSLDSMDTTPAIHPSVYVLLARTKKYLFPNLHTLHAFSEQSTTPLELILCISPSLRSFQLAPSNERYALADITYAVGATLDMLANGSTPSAHLQHLELRATIPAQYLDKLISLKNLRTLRVNGVSPESADGDEGSDYLERLSTLPYLQNLLLSLGENESFLPVPNHGFRSLKHLVIQSDEISLQRFLSVMPSNRLQHITIMDGVLDWNTRVSGPIELRSRLEGWRECFVELARQAQTLTSLRLTLRSMSAGPEHVSGWVKNLPMLTIIQPLLELRGLGIAELIGFIGMPYSDEDVLDIATAWPKIKHMALPPPHAEAKQPSLTSLPFLSRFCPKLEELSMTLDLKNEYSVAPRSEHLKHLETMPLANRHLLHELDLCDSHLEELDIQALVKRLRSMFPVLEFVTARKDGELAEKVTELLGPKMSAEEMRVACNRNERGRDKEQDVG